MNYIEVSTPRPYCILLITHPARSHTPACSVNVAETFNRHSVYELGDDFDRVQAEDHLSAIGGFK